MVMEKIIFENVKISNKIENVSVKFGRKLKFRIFTNNLCFDDQWVKSAKENLLYLRKFSGTPKNK